MKHCKKCGNNVPFKVIIKGKTRRLKKNRNFCLNCSPLRLPKSSPPNKRSERRKRKEKLVKILGGKCTKCGYNKSITALSFHHVNPKNKSFDISGNGSLLKDWNILLTEAMKCVLLCLNCHAELHNDENNKG